MFPVLAASGHLSHAAANRLGWAVVIVILVLAVLALLKLLRIIG
jgi:hypothetical protein